MITAMGINTKWSKKILVLSKLCILTYLIFRTSTVHRNLYSCETQTVLFSHWRKITDHAMNFLLSQYQNMTVHKVLIKWKFFGCTWYSLSVAVVMCIILLLWLIWFNFIWIVVNCDHSNSQCWYEHILCQVLKNINAFFNITNSTYVAVHLMIMVIFHQLNLNLSLLRTLILLWKSFHTSNKRKIFLKLYVISNQI